MISIISDMDGVIYRGNNLIEGAEDFIKMLLYKNVPFLFLTNNAEQTPRDLKRKLESLGVKGLDEKHFFTAAQATAIFLQRQLANGTAYVIGTGGLVSELYNVGYSINDVNPDYVVVGKTNAFNFDMLQKAVHLINKGAKFIGCNPDIVDPAPNGELIPAVGPILAAIETATGKKPYIVPIPGTRKLERMLENGKASDIILTEEEVRVLDKELDRMEMSQVFGGTRIIDTQEKE